MSRFCGECLGVVHEEAADDRLPWLLVQVSDTSGIVAAKYRCIRMAICLLGLGSALTGLALAL